MDRSKYRFPASSESPLYLSIFLNSSDLDLDNIDNIYRMLLHMGFQINRKDIIDTVLGFKFRGGRRVFDANKVDLLEKWLESRNLLYNIFMFNLYDFSAKTMIMYATKLAIESKTNERKIDWRITDSDLLFILSEQDENISDVIRRFKKSDFFLIEGLFLTSDDDIINKFLDYNTKNKIEDDLSELLDKEIIINFIYDKGKLSREITIPIIDEISTSQEEVYKIGKNSKTMLIGIFSKGNIKNSLKIKYQKNARAALESIIGSNFFIFPSKFEKEIKLKGPLETQLNLGAFRHE